MFNGVKTFFNDVHTLWVLYVVYHMYGKNNREKKKYNKKIVFTFAELKWVLKTKICLYHIQVKDLKR